jgi:hypothetical protein
LQRWLEIVGNQRLGDYTKLREVVESLKLIDEVRGGLWASASYHYSICIEGRLYDWQAERQHISTAHNS